jgi:hypothetical protein
VTDKNVGGQCVGTEATREQRRSERVKLNVPLIVMIETLEHVKVQEVTHTVVVNAHGGLFKLKMEVLVGQPMILTNLQTNVEKRCRVVRVEQLPADEFGIAFEFEAPSPEFWPVSAPPADWKIASS